MKASFLLAAVLLVGLPLAANATTPQQQRMAECSAKTKGLKGDAYKTAQSSCLSGHAAETKAVNPQQERMRKCNADAGAKKLAGDARKTFMSSCLKSS
ncbi:starvation-inducible protein [Stenotrophomonas maltophilia]|uniref:Starvation-inducible protein n=1 Tax=Stenotrophomonas maltophilia TaxID=40324 RepID=A0AA41CDW4_STEMA|nr:MULTISPECIES: PsiF family protein [Stenotrophomonas]AWB78011.1 starvation-inducible protein [Stenotrophomonas maltophilia]KOO76414.1 starvation-inducible protein [Stenotrophomonas maltophilia]MBH1585188.1 starvation-inducible protein [Stenotrophomonas maltophilia]MBH1717094.1 starvation-inducible protein [Stenotrophomonas maltophilia]MBH1790299.1 starvation-inducible protein [Stenotrophomonas maltophilia]